MTETGSGELEATMYQALNEGDDASLRAAGLRMAGYASGDFPAFRGVLNALGFHNRQALINEMMREAWPQVESTRSYSRSAVEAYAARATDHLIYAYLQREPQAEQPDEALLERLEFYFPVDAQRLEPYIQLLSGRVGRPWSETDFEPLRMPALSGLMVEFLGFGRQVGVPYARSHLLRELLPRYLLDRQAGNLQPKPDVAATLRGERRPFPQPLPTPLHPLAPDRPSLLLFLQRLLQTAYP
ncbi:MAG TPA: hypothetical protein VE553_04015, partial [Candidatus Binatia bacterium]|nr:hypothetical protein [Candidatus Binatia bacterium]